MSGGNRLCEKSSRLLCGSNKGLLWQQARILTGDYRRQPFRSGSSPSAAPSSFLPRTFTCPNPSTTLGEIPIVPLLTRC